LGEIRVYLLDDLLRRLGKDCEICVYSPAKRRFLNYECRKCIEQAERLVHSIVPDENYILNPEKLYKRLTRRPPKFLDKRKAYWEWKQRRQREELSARMMGWAWSKGLFSKTLPINHDEEAFDDGFLDSSRCQAFQRDFL